MKLTVLVTVFPASLILIGFAGYLLFAHPCFGGSLQANGIISAICATVGVLGVIYSYGTITRKNPEKENGN